MRACRNCATTRTRFTRTAWPTRSISSSPRISIFVGDGGDVVTFAGNVVRPRPGLWMDPGRSARSASGTGFAMAAKLVHPEKEVVALFATVRLR